MGCLSLTYQEPKSSLRIIYKNESPRLLEEKPSFFQGVLEKKVCAKKKCSSSYRYGFNGMEKDNEVAGEGNHYTTEFRQLDVRIGRWFSMDPVTHAQYSPYSTFDNNPIYWVDPKGANAWNPEVGDNGVIIYEAEEGDSAQSLADQFGLDLNVAEEITGTLGDEEIESCTVISGEKVKEVTGSQILKFNLDNFAGERDWKTLDWIHPDESVFSDFAKHMIFAMREANINLDLDHQYLQLSDYFSNIPGRVNKQTIDAEVPFEGQLVPISIDMDLSQRKTTRDNGTLGKINLYAVEQTVFNIRGKYFKQLEFTEYNGFDGSLFNFPVMSYTIPVGTEQFDRFEEYVNP